MEKHQSFSIENSLKQFSCFEDYQIVDHQIIAKTTRHDCVGVETNYLSLTSSKNRVGTRFISVQTQMVVAVKYLYNKYNM